MTENLEIQKLIEEEEAGHYKVAEEEGFLFSAIETSIFLHSVNLTGKHSVVCFSQPKLLVL